MNAHPALAADEAGQAALQEEARNVALRNTMRVQRIQDFIFHKVTLLFAASVLIVLVGIIVSLAIGAAPAFREFGASFLTTNEWDPVNDKFGALIAITGTLVTSIIALLVAFPISFGIALFLTEIAPAWLRGPVGTGIELCAARWAWPSNCWPACRRSSTACGACSCSRRCSATPSSRS
jgi:phosphate transport system permease protein